VRTWIGYFSCAATYSEIALMVKVEMMHLLLFRDCVDGQGGNDAFVVDGWCSWNKKDRLDTHVGDVNSFHNVSVERCDVVMNQD